MPLSKEELRRRQRDSLAQMKTDTKRVHGACEPLPEDAPRFGSFAEDNPAVHAEFGRKARSKSRVKA